MKIHKINSFLLSILLLCSTAIVASPMQTELNSGWMFKQWRLTNWYPAAVPGVVHTDLIKNKIIEDPFFRLNERGVQWIDKEDWMYVTHFDLTDEMFNRGNIRLVFKGIDTYADVYLNGQKLFSANNMFREWKADIKKLAKKTDNKLEVLLLSPIKMDIPKFDALPYQYPTGPDQSENGGIFNKTVSVFARKAGYHYGWDWGPRLVTQGIWRPVFVQAWDDLRMEDVFVEQKEVTAKKAVITTHVEVIADKQIPGATIKITDKQTGQVFGTTTVDLTSGVNTVTVNFNINNPKLWWSNGLGDPHLYEFKTELIVNNDVKDIQLTKTGIRSLKVINKPDQYGKSLYFELNGVPVFAKGANYVPADNFLPRVTKETYEKNILDAVNVNMNILRVWGGGIYENDYFYELCDKYGILVWQDFMFACSMYPSEGEFLENVRQEAIDNVKRLRNHPSIAIWCGNNEAYDGWFGWGRKEGYEKQNPEYASTIWRQYDDLFHKLLPSVVKEYAPEGFYWRSSPFSQEGKSCDENNGDRHYWGVWHGRHPIARFNTEKSRFFSEYGFQSFPEFESIKKYAPDSADWKITSEVMMDHQRAGAYANKLIEDYLLNEYQKPKDFESFLYMNQVLQGDAIKIAMEAHRRDMPYCMGTIFWQHNDCWPVASWSSRDYYGRWKAQHYFAREAYRDVLISPIANDNVLNVYVVSDRLKAVRGTMTLQILKLDGTVIATKKQAVEIAANTSKKVYLEQVDKLLDGNSPNDVVVTAQLVDNKGNVYHNNYFLRQQKFINFPKVSISRTVRPTDNGFEITLQADKFARAVFLSINGIDNFFENNYFDMLPQTPTTVKVKTKLSQADFEKQLKVVSLSDAY